MMRWARIVAVTAALGIFTGAAAVWASTLTGTGPAPAPISICPNWIRVVGSTNGGTTADPAGLTTIVVNDKTGAPINGALVTVNFSPCCDFLLCDTPLATPPGAGPVTIDCVGRTISGMTGPPNPPGAFVFYALGAAKDPGNIIPPGEYPGCGLNGITIAAEFPIGSLSVLLATATASSFDLNGAATPPGSNGVTIGDVAASFLLLGQVALGAPYKGRGDFNCDGSDTIADVALEFAKFGQLGLIGGAGCSSAFCVQQPKPPCP